MRQDIGKDFKGELTFDNEQWYAVGQTWNDAMIYVMTKTMTALTNDGLLIGILAIVFLILAAIITACGILFTKDAIHGRMPHIMQ